MSILSFKVVFIVNVIKKNGFSLKYCLETNIEICFIYLLEITKGVLKDTMSVKN